MKDKKKIGTTTTTTKLPATSKTMKNSSNSSNTSINTTTKKIKVLNKQTIFLKANTQKINKLNSKNDIINIPFIQYTDIIVYLC